MLAYLTSVWDYRHFWVSLVRIDLRTRYRRSVLGMGWSLLHPILMTVILCTVFSQVFKVDIRTFGPYLLTGLAAWNYITSTCLTGCACLFQAESYIRQQPAPLAIYSLRTTLGGTIHFSIALSVVVVASWLFHGLGNVPTLIWLVPSLVLLFIFLWSSATVFGILNVLFPDVHYLAEIGFQIIFYATPIIYPARFLQNSSLGYYLSFNPFGHFLEMLRAPILDCAAPSLANISIASAATLFMAVLATLLVRRFQRTLIFRM